jgi:gluconolactonase
VSKSSLLAVVVPTFFLSPIRADDASPVAPGAKVVKLAGGFKFTEGPAPDAQGNVYFTDQPNDRIHIWSTDGKLSTFMEPCGRSNGLCFDKEGRLWACVDEKNELWRIDVKTKEKTVLVKAYNGKLLNGPNDIWVRPDGGAYFTDPFYKRPYWKRGGIEQDVQGVFYFSPDGKLTRVEADVKQTNGIIGTPDGKTLYVADIGANKSYAYDIQEDGRHDGRRRGQCLSHAGQSRHCFRQDRQANLEDRRAGRDDQRLLRRQGDEDAVHHRGHEPVFD